MDDAEEQVKGQDSRIQGPTDKDGGTNKEGRKPREESGVRYYSNKFSFERRAEFYKIRYPLFVHLISYLFDGCFFHSM